MAGPGPGKHSRLDIYIYMNIYIYIYKYTYIYSVLMFLWLPRASLDDCGESGGGKERCQLNIEKGERTKNTSTKLYKREQKQWGGCIPDAELPYERLCQLHRAEKASPH